MEHFGRGVLQTFQTGGRDEQREIPRKLGTRGQLGRKRLRLACIVRVGPVWGRAYVEFQPGRQPRSGLGNQQPDQRGCRRQLP
ncbi:hypothetical protein D3C86_1941920 [compost metagenome]